MDENTIIKDNLNLIRTVINKHYPKYKGDEDIFQIGMIGLWKAIKLFDESKGTKFSTFAYTAIRNEIGNELRKSKSTSEIPPDHIESLDEAICENGSMSMYDKLVAPEDISYQVFIDEFKYSLKGRKREIFELLLTYSTKGKDIAEKLGVSKQCVSVELMKIRKQFRDTYFGGDYK